MAGGGAGRRLRVQEPGRDRPRRRAAAAGRRGGGQRGRGADRRARYARAFNTLGWENFADPLPGTDLFFASDPQARPAAEELISAIGLGPVYVGGADAAGAVDSLLGLWVALTRQNGTRKLAFRLVR